MILILPPFFLVRVNIVGGFQMHKKKQWQVGREWTWQRLFLCKYDEMVVTKGGMSSSRKKSKKGGKQNKEKGSLATRLCPKARYSEQQCPVHFPRASAAAMTRGCAYSPTDGPDSRWMDFEPIITEEHLVWVLFDKNHQWLNRFDINQKGSETHVGF